MVSEQTADSAIAQIREAIAQGAEAIGVQLEWLVLDQRDNDTLRRIFAACDGRPIYATQYRNRNNEGFSDEQLAELLVNAVECGATLVDVMGDLYAPAQYEMTFDEEAVAKQRALIDRIHQAGGEALMSSHFQAFLEEETVIRFARAQQERGADVIKMVTHAQNEAQLIADLKIVERLRSELQKPFLFLANGPYCYLLRQTGPERGVCMYLCRTAEEGEQPRIATIRYLRDGT